MLVSRDYYSMVVVLGESAAISDALSTACYNIDYDHKIMINKNFPNYDLLFYS